MSDIKTDIWEELRKPFPSETVGLLPKVSCYNCTQATKTAKSALDKHCSQHRMEKCNDCGAYITTGHIHLDYVGHAAVTDRLNNAVGPDNWTWRPLATDEHGLPLLDKNGNLWIELTVAGVSRIGYGDGSSSIKELIGDALRNAAMRFGVALDLWSKDELESTLDAPETKNVRPSASTKPTRADTAQDAEVIDTKTVIAQIGEELEAKGFGDAEERKAIALAAAGVDSASKASPEQWVEVFKTITAMSVEELTSLVPLALEPEDQSPFKPARKLDVQRIHTYLKSNGVDEADIDQTLADQYHVEDSANMSHDDAQRVLAFLEAKKAADAAEEGGGEGAV